MQCAVPVLLKCPINDNFIKQYLRVGDTKVANSFKAGEPDDGRRTIENTFVAIQHLLQLIGKFATASQDDGVNLTTTKSVPTFYAGELETWAANKNANLVFGTVAIIFGAIHCIAWTAAFPSHTEQVLWRISSVAIIGVPGIYLIIFIVGNILLNMAYGNSKTMKSIMKIIMSPLILVYLIARIVLFILAFLSLRSLPPCTFEAVH